MATAAATLLFAASLPFTPLAAPFGLLPLPLHFHAVPAGMSVAYLVPLELAKRTFYRMDQRPGGPGRQSA